MPNKHQIQKDFYRKQKDWKEQIKVNDKETNKDRENAVRNFKDTNRDFDEER